VDLGGDFGWDWKGASVAGRNSAHWESTLGNTCFILKCDDMQENNTVLSYGINE
jgi:hypothetical protein